MPAPRILNRGQIGPFSFEVLFPLVIALIITFVFITLTFSSVMRNLQEREAQVTHKTAADLLEVLSKKSSLTHANTPQLLDYEAIQKTTCEELYLYCPAAYNCSIQIIEAGESKTCGGPAENAVALDMPVAILHKIDDIRSGKIKTWVWRQK
ncbi:MAG: hypothetical protein WAX07_06860 [Candidatus Altiarchaeia archaeon]